MEIVLSVLIATMPSRNKNLDSLLSDFGKQSPWAQSFTQFLTDDSLDYNIGVKRNDLLKRALGNYIVFVDDDDHVTPDYLEKIIFATGTFPDCIGISGTITTNGRDERQWRISKEYGSWYERNGVYYRTPNHISPVKRELALQAGFPEIAFGEDAEYSRRLLPLLKTEVIIPGNIYHYDYISSK